LSKTITTNVSVAVSGDGFAGSPLYTDSLVNTAGSVPGSVALTANTFLAQAVPASATGLTLVPPPGNAGTMTLKGVTGDTGLALGVIQQAVRLPFAAGSMATIGLLCSVTSTWGLLWG
jgi:hypothetical protein